MTGAQASWLKKNPAYRALSQTPSGMRWTRVGFLYEEGTFIAHPPRGRAPVKVGCFEVGVLEEIQRGGMQR